MCVCILELLSLHVTCNVCVYVCERQKEHERECVVVCFVSEYRMAITHRIP